MEIESILEEEPKYDILKNGAIVASGAVLIYGTARVIAHYAIEYYDTLANIMGQI